MLDATRYRLLNEWQRGFPLVPRPFAAVGRDRQRSIFPYSRIFGNPP